MIKFNVWFSIAQSILHRKIRKCHFLWAETAIAMKSSSEGKEQHLPVMTRSFPVAEEGCTWWELGMALLQWHGAVSRAVQTQTTQSSLSDWAHWLPEKKAQLPFCPLVFTVLVLLCSCSPLQFLTLWQQFIVSPACWGWKRLPRSPQHTPECHTHTQLDEAACFDNSAVCSHSFPAQTCRASFLWKCSFWALESHWDFCFILSLSLHVYKCPLTLTYTPSSPDPCFQLSIEQDVSRWQPTLHWCHLVI